jgi:hypothetical protein
MGILLALNWLSARDRLIQQLRRNHRHPHGSARRTWTWRLADPAIQLLGVAWIPMGILALTRGSTNLH